MNTERPDQVEPDFVEPRFEKRFLAFGLGFPWAVAFCFAAVALILRRGEPEPLGLWWSNHHAEVEASYPQFVLISAIVIGVLGSICGALAGLRLRRRWLRRLMMGLAVGISLLGCSAGASLLIGQQGKATAHDGGPDGIVFALGAGASLALAVIMVFTFQPVPIWNKNDEAALARMTAELSGAPGVKYWLHPRASTFVFLTMIVLLPGGLLSLLSPWITLSVLLVAVLIMANLCASVTIDQGAVTVDQKAEPDGRVAKRRAEPALTVRIAGFLPVLKVTLAQIHTVEVAQIKVWDHGGPGYRRRAGDGEVKGDGKARNFEVTEQFLTRDGEALVLTAPGRKCVLGVAQGKLFPSGDATVLRNYLRSRAS